VQTPRSVAIFRFHKDRAQKPLRRLLFLVSMVLTFFAPPCTIVGPRIGEVAAKAAGDDVEVLRIRPSLMVVKAALCERGPVPLSLRGTLFCSRIDSDSNMAFTLSWTYSRGTCTLCMCRRTTILRKQHTTSSHLASFALEKPKTIPVMFADVD